MVIISYRAIRFFAFILGSKPEHIQGLAFFPFIFVPNGNVINDRLVNHERIHLRQQLELLVLPFHIWYLIALYRKGYMGISFEKEAYANDHDLDYLKTRKMFSFIKYM